MYGLWSRRLARRSTIFNLDRMRLLFLNRGVHGVLLFDSQYFGPERWFVRDTFCFTKTSALSMRPSYMPGVFSSTLIGLLRRKCHFSLSAHSFQSISAWPTRQHSKWEQIRTE